MLTHIVIWKYNPETTTEQREKHLAMLKNLPSAIEVILNFNVGFDSLFLPRSYDTGLVAVFKDQAALDAYTIHPTHQEVANYGKEIAQHAASVDFSK